MKPFVFMAIGLNVIQRKNLPVEGPCILAPNHNSHLDTMVLMSLYPINVLHKVRPIAAADYFLKNKFMTWFSLNIIGIIPLDRSGASVQSQLFNECEKALQNKEILILFPEGSRGDPEKMASLKKGIYHLAVKCQGTKIFPIYLQGLGRSLPKGEALLVPFNCDVVVGEGVSSFNSADELLEILNKNYIELSQKCITKVDL